MKDDDKELKVVEAEAAALVKQYSVLNTAQLQLLHRATPARHRFTRKGRGGEQWEYVTGQYVEMYLNALTGHDWDFTIKDFRQIGKQVIVQGTLTMRFGIKKGDRHSVVKEQFGRADVKYLKGTDDTLDLGNDFKAAATDCLKKCASMFGIAWDVYGKDEFKEINVVKSSIPAAKNTKKDIEKALDDFTPQPIETGEVV